MEAFTYISQIYIDQIFSSPINGTGVGFAGLTYIVLQNIISISAVVFMLLIVGGGIAFMVGAGNDNPQAAAKGKQAITAAVIGFAIIFTSYWIVQAISILTGTDLI